MARFSGRSSSSIYKDRCPYVSAQYCLPVCCAVAILFRWIPNFGSVPSPELLLEQERPSDVCNLKALKESITSPQFHALTFDISQTDVVALAKAELFLHSPFFDDYPMLIRTCESQGSIGSIVKQVYLQDMLDLQAPERVIDVLLGKATKKHTASIVDIGANIGQFGLPLAKAGHKVYSFEPVNSTCTTLKENIEKAGVADRMKGICSGVSQKEETLSFGYTGEPVPSASYKIIDPTDPNAHVMSTVLTGPVQNYLTADELNTIDFFKTDTQGNEEAVLRGSHSLLHGPTRPRFLLVEFSHFLLKSVGTNPRTILELIYEAGYMCTHLRYHHPTLDQQTFGPVDTPHFLQGGTVTATFDEMDRSVGPHKEWTLNGKALPAAVQDRPGWTDLLCFG